MAQKLSGRAACSLNWLALVPASYCWCCRPIKPLGRIYCSERHLLRMVQTRPRRIANQQQVMTTVVMAEPSKALRDTASAEAAWTVPPVAAAD